MESSKIKRKDLSQDKISSKDNLSLITITEMETEMKESPTKEDKEIVRVATIKVVRMATIKVVRMVSKESLMEMVKTDLVARMSLSLNLTISQATISPKSKANLKNTITDFYNHY